MRVRAVALATVATLCFHASASAPASAHDIGEKFIREYRKAYPTDRWELVGRTIQAGNMVRVFFKRETENTLRTTNCTRLQKRSKWVCEAGPNLPEGSLVIGSHHDGRGPARRRSYRSAFSGLKNTSPVY